MKTNTFYSSGLLLILLVVFSGFFSMKKKPVSIYLIGDSTMADYTDNYDEGKDYYKTRYPITGWGQVFQEQFDGCDLSSFQALFKADSVIVKDHARGGRSTRTFFQEARWRKVYDQLEKGDLVLIQFGHNDAAQGKTERYVDIQGYQEFLRLYVSQTRAKGAIPIILTPVCRNYPWEMGHLQNVHGEYPQAAKDIALEMNTHLIDLNQLSMDAFSKKGEPYVTTNYFLNLAAGQYEAYPDGKSDNTHFQPEGAKAVATLVFEALKTLR
ncbi:rhamnogalacturonan acetylesterase [Reichenbachiella agarivorans]|uniref:Rhamnogalacturonan acetylesterase n=1 Tax=Reichenbachiella agarivorans TaxID=2979464 RepID=A0ABY6CVA1_9BACT|nr:rhamnogalacturonan acetylesterase [Reichenbachiella agarivorans]UXP32175.1 rhamnogalacturonan acetylesterase [Reichenbachiella agarivorans]